LVSLVAARSRFCDARQSERETCTFTGSALHVIRGASHAAFLTNEFVEILSHA
jgi:hypothetical protein